jgi:hypothetical protein
MRSTTQPIPHKIERKSVPAIKARPPKSMEALQDSLQELSHASILHLTLVDTIDS